MPESTDHAKPIAVAPVRRRNDVLRRISQALGPALGLSLFCLALWVLHRELAGLRVQDVREAMMTVPSGRLVAALVLVVIDYVLMTNYDLLAVRHIGRQFPRIKVMKAAFLSFAFSNNVGFSVLGSGAMRLRQYGMMGLSAPEVAKLMAFTMSALGLGLLTMAGIVFSLAGTPVPQGWPGWLRSTRPLGFVLLGVVIAYFSMCKVRRKPFSIRGLEFSLPKPRLALAQVVTGVLDWSLTGIILYVLLPQSLPFGTFVAAYAAAQAAGMISGVPGGIGVFETVMIVSLGESVPHGQLISILLVYRCLYYLLPFAVAAVAVAVVEFRTYRRALAGAGEFYDRRIAVLLPPAAAGAAFAVGAVMLLAGPLPAAAGRLAWLSRLLNPVAVAVSHFLASLVGLALLLLARGLQRRLDAAYWAAISLLAVGILLVVLRGDALVTAAVPAVGLFILAPARQQFYRRASLWGERFTPAWTAAVILVIAGSVWLGLFSYRHVVYADDLWWRVGLSDDAPRFLRASLGVVVAATVVALLKLLRPARGTATLPTPTDMQDAERIVRSSPRTRAWLALLGDKQFLFNRERTAFIMYGTQGRSRISLGNPVGLEADWKELCWDFRQLCDLHGSRSVFYQVGPQDLPRYVDLGVSFIELGEEARVPLANFTLEGGQRRDLRQEANRAVKAGCHFEILPAEAVPEYLPDFRRISDAWLAEKGIGEKGFSLGYFDDAYLSRSPAAVIRVQERVVAFANVLVAAGKEELTVDLMRHLPDCPPGVMTYMFVQLMLWGRSEGYAHFSLGMAPLSGFEPRELAPLWQRLGHWVYCHGEHFYGFEGLRLYKEKFDPIWQPRYLASPGGLALPQVLADLVLLIGRRKPDGLRQLAETGNESGKSNGPGKECPSMIPENSKEIP